MRPGVAKDAFGQILGPLGGVWIVMWGIVG
jgi:hypothetical protein